MVRPCEENERGAHGEKNARCGNTTEKKKRAAKPKMERRMQERHDRDGYERGQDNIQGSMEEYHHQLYRRPQMTGQASEEEEWIKSKRLDNLSLKSVVYVLKEIFASHGIPDIIMKDNGPPHYSTSPDASVVSPFFPIESLCSVQVALGVEVSLL